MKTSLFDLFKIGIGPSSSHTVGPMRAARRFVQSLADENLLSRTSHVVAELYGSLALTGHGHGTDRAILLGLSGERPDQIDPDSIDSRLASIRSSRQLSLNVDHIVPFNESTDLVFHRDQMLPPQAEPAIAGTAAQHPNGMRFTAYDSPGSILSQQIFFSVGGGFILSAAELAAQQLAASDSASPQSPSLPVPYPFSSAATLLSTAAQHNLSIPQLMLANEAALQPGNSLHEKESAVRAGIARIWQAMQDCCDRGMITEGILPGGLNVRRRAPRLAARLREKASSGLASDPLAPIDWVSVYAMAVNEENAAGGRVVTAPTNGAAGVLPAVGLYYLNFIAPHASHTPACGPSLRMKSPLPNPAATPTPLLTFQVSTASSSPPPPSAFFIKRTPPSPAQKSAARAKSASPAPWPPAESSPPSMAPTMKSNTPPKSPWNTTSA